MSNTVANIENSEIITVMQSSLYPSAAPASISLVLSYCRAAKLDPMMKPVHIVPMWDRDSGRMRDVIMPGIGLYRTMAARSGQYAGMTEPEFGDDVTEAIGGQSITYPKWCKITVKRIASNGVIAEFTAVERWKENYAIKGGKEKSIAPNAMWTRRPYGQIAKCAQAQALRMAFPELVPAQPTAEEMEGNEYGNVAIVVNETQQITPTAGAGERVAQDRKPEIKDLSIRAIEWIESGSIADAVLEIDNAELDPDEKVYLWTFFDSKQRSAMKKEVKRMRDEATAKAQQDAIAKTNAGAKESGVINEAQKRRLEARITEFGINREAVKTYCRETHGAEHFSDLTQSAYDDVDGMLEHMALASQA